MLREWRFLVDRERESVCVCGTIMLTDADGLCKNVGLGETGVFWYVRRGVMEGRSFMDHVVKVVGVEVFR